MKDTFAYTYLLQVVFNARTKKVFPAICQECFCQDDSTVDV